MTAVAVAYSGFPQVVTGSDDKSTKIWDANGQVMLSTMHSDVVNSVGWSPDGWYVVSGVGRRAELCDAGSGAVLRSFLGHAGTVVSGALSPGPTGGAYVVTGSADNTSRVWDAATGEELRCFPKMSLTPS